MTGKQWPEPGVEIVLVRTRWTTNSLADESILGRAYSKLAEHCPWYRNVEEHGDLAGLVARHPIALVEATLVELEQQTLESFCLSAIDTLAAGLVAEEPVMTATVAEEFPDMVNGGFLDAVREREVPEWRNSSGLEPSALCTNLT